MAHSVCRRAFSRTACSRAAVTIRAALLSALLLLPFSSRRVMAHPMPNTVIAVRIDEAFVTLHLAIPLPELRLAMREQWPQAQALVDTGGCVALGRMAALAVRGYMQQHLVIRSGRGAVQAWALDSLELWATTDENVGRYQELRATIHVPATADFNPRHFELAYDGVIHQVPNHFALVQLIEDVRSGRTSDDAPEDLGVIRYDFSRDRVEPLRIDAGAPRADRGVGKLIAIGFLHVLEGADHLLFLATLLVVAPLRGVRGRWAPFEGWRYALKRFLTISLAFTLGHSLALAMGVYGYVRLPSTVVEATIALSILITAVHAIRPLFPQREWLVAIFFGSVHGLAFAAALADLHVGTVTRLSAVLGFNIGVELAQLLVMCACLPVVALARWRGYERLRVALMLATAGIAIVWMVDRLGVRSMIWWTDEPRASPVWGMMCGTSYHEVT